MDDMIGKLVGRYLIMEKIEEDTFTISFKAIDEKLDDIVTLKFLKRSNEYSQEFTDFFMQKVKGLAKLSHQGIVKVLDVGTFSENTYIVMEYISDQSLAQIMNNPLQWEEAVKWLIPIAEALDYAHANGIIHRDLKPENILIDFENKPIISDFNIVQIIESEETRDVTGTNVGLSSPDYMSPEQGRGLNVDYRADIYSLGIIFYEMVTAKKPFQGENGMEIVIQQVTLLPPSPRKIIPDLPIEIEKIILTALKKDPEDRFQSMREFISALESSLDIKRRGERKYINLSKNALLKSAALFLLLFCILFLSINIFPLSSGIQSISTTPTIPGILPTSTATIVSIEVVNKPTIIPPATKKTSEPTQTPQLSLPPYPLLEGTSLPTSEEVISPESIQKIKEIARWGTPKYNNVVWFPDDSKLVAATSFGVFFLDKNTLQVNGFFDAKGWITTLCISPDGKWIATGDQQGIVRIWDSFTGIEKYTLEGHSAEITTLQFSKNGERIASGSADKTINIWDAANGKELFTLKKHAYSINAAVFTNEGKYLISGADDFKLIVWDVETGSLLKQVAAGHMIRDIAISHDDRIIALALKNATIELWDLASLNSQKKIVFKDYMQVEATNSLVFSPTDYFLASGADDGIVRIWNVSNKKLDHKLSTLSKSQKLDKEIDGIKHLAFSNDGDILISQTKGGETALWDYVYEIIKANSNTVWSSFSRVNFNFSAEKLAVQNGKSEIEIRDVLNGNRVATFTAQIPLGNIFASEVDKLAMTKKDELLISDTKLIISNTPWISYSANSIFAFLPEDNILVAANLRYITIWSVSSLQELDPASEKIDRNCMIVYFDDGRFMAAGSNIGVFSDETIANNLCKINKNPRSVVTTFSTDGNYVAFGLETKMIELWDSKNDFNKSTLIEDGNGKVMDVAFSPDSRLMASANEDGKVRIRDLGTKQLVFILDHHHAPVSSVAFSKDGRWLATSSYDGSIELWGIIK